MSSDLKSLLIGGFVIVTLIVLLVVGISGPVGITNQLTAWKASAYGSDWLVVQYTFDGKVLNYWELKNAAVHNEAHSDGIYFTTDHGVIHLSSQYLFVQNPSADAKEKYLKASHVSQ